MADQHPAQCAEYRIVHIVPVGCVHGIVRTNTRSDHGATANIEDDGTTL